MRLFALVLVVACGRSAEPGVGFREGDAYLALNGDTLMGFRATRVTPALVNGEVFGSQREHSREQVIPERELGTAGCAPVGRIALVKTTDRMWDYGLAVGSDGERCYLQESSSSTQRTPAIVYALPARYDAMFAPFRPALEAQWARRTFVLRWPADWTPGVGMDVVMRAASGLRPAKIVERRPGALRLVVPGAFSGETTDTWRSPRQVAPVPSSSGPPTSGAYLCNTDDARACVELVPATAATYPVVALDDADVIGRSHLVNDLMVELGGIHSRRMNGKLVWIRPDGTPILEARSEVALTKDGEGTYAAAWTRANADDIERPAGWSRAERDIRASEMLPTIEALARAAKPLLYQRVGDDVVFVYGPRIVLPADDALRSKLGAAARRTLADLSR